MPPGYDDANRDKIQHQCDLINPLNNLQYMPRYVIDVIRHTMPGYCAYDIWDRMFAVRVALCGAEMHHDFAHFLNMAYHDSAVLDWWLNNVILNQRQAEDLIAEKDQGGVSLRYQLLGMADSEVSAPAACVLLKYGMGSGKTILQAGLISEMVEKSKVLIRAGQSPGHLPHPTKPAVVIFATIAERDSFYELLRGFLVFDADSDIFCINDSLRFSRDLRRFAIEGAYVCLVCVAGIISTFTDRASNEDLQGELDRSCASIQAGEHVDPRLVGLSMAKLLRLRTPFRSRDLHVIPSMLFFSEFNAIVDQMISMLSLCPILDDIITTWGRTARWVFMDGSDLGDISLRFAAAFKGLSNVVLHFNFAPPRTLKTIQMNDLDAWIGKLDAAIQSGVSPIVITCDTVRDTNLIFKALTTIYNVGESDIYKCTGLDNDEHKALLADLRSLASRVRFILTSPVLQRGISDSVTDIHFQCALYRGYSVKARSATQPLNRFRLSMRVEVCVISPPGEVSTDVGNQAVYLLNTIAYCKLFDGGMSDPAKFKPFHHTPFQSGGANQRYQSGWRPAVGGPSISGANHMAGHQWDTLLRVNKEVHTDRAYYVCQCRVLTPEVQYAPCPCCNSEFAKVRFEAESVKSNPYLNVAGLEPSWYPAGNVNKLNYPVPFDAQYQFTSTFAGKHYKPVEHAAILAAADEYKRAFRFGRAFMDAAKCEGYIVNDPDSTPVALSVNGKLFRDLFNETECAATVRIAELLSRFEADPTFNISQRVKAYSTILGMGDDIELPNLRLLQEMTWPWTEEAEEPNFFDKLHTSLGMTSALSGEYIDRTLDMLGNHSIEYYRECAPSAFNPIAMGLAYETWLLMHLVSLIHIAKPSPTFSPVNGHYGNFILECLHGDIKWKLTETEGPTLLLSLVGTLKEKVTSFLCVHSESIFTVTHGKCRLSSNPTLENLFDATCALMGAVLNTRPVKTKARGPREDGRGRTTPASPTTYTLPTTVFTVRLMIIWCRAVRGTNKGRLSNPDIMALLRAGIGRIPNDHWFCDLLCGVDHPGEAPGDVTFLRTPGVSAKTTAELNKFARRVVAFLSNKPEATLPNSAKRSFITQMWRQIASDTEPTDMQIQESYDAIHGDMNESDDESDDTTFDRAAFDRQWAEDERAHQIRLHTNIRQEGTYVQRNVRRRLCPFFDDEADSE